MSKRATERVEKDFGVVVAARRATLHTLKITKNKKIFFPELDHAVLDGIIAVACDIFDFVTEANDIRVDQELDGWKNRYLLQIKAKKACNILLRKIGLAKYAYHLRARKVLYWGKLIRTAKRAIIAWHESDCKRYGGRPPM